MFKDRELTDLSMRNVMTQGRCNPFYLILVEKKIESERLKRGFVEFIDADLNSSSGKRKQTKFTARAMNSIGIMACTEDSKQQKTNMQDVIFNSFRFNVLLAISSCAKLKNILVSLNSKSIGKFTSDLFLLSDGSHSIEELECIGHVLSLLCEYFPSIISQHAIKAETLFLKLLDLAEKSEIILSSCIYISAHCKLRKSSALKIKNLIKKYPLEVIRILVSTVKGNLCS